MSRSRFLWKLYAGYVFLILLATGIVGTLLAVRVENNTLVDIDRRLRAEAMLLRDIAATELRTGSSGDPARVESRTSRLQERAKALGAEIGTRLTIIRADGLVIADSDENPERMDNHGQRPEVLEALERGVGTSSRFSQTVRKEMRYLALRVENGQGEVLGYARASVPLTTIASRLGQVRNDVVVAAAIALGVALILGFLYARRVTKPVQLMARVAESIAGGNYKERVEIDSNDELGDLAQSINRMNRQLQRSIATVEGDRNKLEAILSSMVEGVVAVDHNQRVVHMNGIAGELLGIDAGDVSGLPLDEVLHLREISEALSETVGWDRLVHRVIRLPKAEDPVTRRPGTSSADRILDVHASPLKTGLSQPGGEVLAGAVLVIADVTQLRRLETMRRDFVGNVSHELKTPVTAIRGLVETLLDDPEIDPIRRVRFLTKIRNQSERLSSLVTDLLSLSRLESGGVEELEPIDVRHAVKSSLRSLRPTAEARRITTEADLPDKPVMVEADEEILVQAVSNLLDNSLKYTPEGGSVWVRVRSDEQEGVVQLEVEDTGIGIEPRHRDRIFERFYRVDKARSREMGGTGLGLAIVKHVALALGGSVSVDSTPGKGSRFRIRLPQADPASTETTSFDLQALASGF